MSQTQCLSDPYAHWLPLEASAASDQQVARNQVLPIKLFDGQYVPIVLQANDNDQAKKWWKEIINRGLGHAQMTKNSEFLSVQLKDQHVLKFIQRFEDAGIRWELGAPFGSPAAYIPANQENNEENGEKEERSEDEDRGGYEPKSKARKVIGIIDYGCAFANDQFRKLVNGKRGGSRVFAIWDQQVRLQAASLMNDITGVRSASNPQPYQSLYWEQTRRYGYGMQTVRDWSQSSVVNPKRPAGVLGIDAFIQQFDDPVHGFDGQTCYRYANYEAIQDREVTHGTYIMDFAAGIPNPLANFSGNWKPSKDKDIDDADIVFVQLPRIFDGENVAGILRTFVLDAVMYIMRCTQDDADLVINLSYGGIAGPHDGSSVVEQAIDDLIQQRRKRSSAKGSTAITELVVCAGNSRASHMHACRTVDTKGQKSDHAELTLSVIPDNPTVQFIDMWMDSELMNAKLDLLRPDGSSALAVPVSLGSGTVHLLKDSLGAVVGQICAPSSSRSKPARVLLGLNPTFACEYYQAAPIGLWRLVLKNEDEKHSIDWNAWCERNDPVFGSGYGPRQVKFVEHTSELATENNLASGALTTVVGGLVANEPDFMAEYSGQGPHRNQQHAIANANSYIDTSILYAPSEESLAYWPLAAAGVFGQVKVRYPGTSVASAVVTRALISGITKTELDRYKPRTIRQVFS